jgi:hypothetical protein
MPRECWLWFHYYTTKRARSARVKKRRRRLENEKEDERDCDAYETANLEGYGRNLAPSSSHVCLSRFEALVVSLRRLTPPSRSSRSTTPRVASSQDGFYRRFPPRHRSRVGRVQAWRHAPRARARYVPRGRDIPARPLACG